MGRSFEDPRTDDLGTHRHHWTRIVLEEHPDGEWLATQYGVDVEGRGDTADAARSYCRAIGEWTDGRA